MDSHRSVHYNSGSYSQQIPINAGKAMVKSFAVSAVVQVLITGDPRIALLRGTTAIVASAIYSLITPIFKQYCVRHHLSFGQEFFKKTIAIIGAGALASSYFGDIFVMRTLLAHCFLNGIFQNKEDRRYNLSPTIII